MSNDIFNNDDRQYLQMMQDNITRMANNSANCKTWTVTLVTGLCAIGCGIDELNGWIFLAIIPILVFWHLDTLYLHLERKMRNRELDFIVKKKRSEQEHVAYLSALYNFRPLSKTSLTPEEKEQGFVLTNDRRFSKSILPFYGGIILVLVVILLVINLPVIVDFFESMFCNC